MRAKHAISPKKNGIPFRINRSIWPTTSHVRTWKSWVNYSIQFSKKYSFELRSSMIWWFGGLRPPHPPSVFPIFKENTFKQIALVRDLIIRGLCPPFNYFFTGGLLTKFHNPRCIIADFRKMRGDKNGLSCRKYLR